MRRNKGYSPLDSIPHYKKYTKDQIKIENAPMYIINLNIKPLLIQLL